jgi:hypothetical protein
MNDNITTSDINQLRFLLSEISNLLNKVAPKSNRFQTYNQRNNIEDVKLEYLKPSNVCHILNIDMNRLSDLLSSGILEYRLTRENQTEVLRDSVLRYINEQKEID